MPLIGDRRSVAAPSVTSKSTLPVAVLDDAALLDQPAEPDARARRRRLGDDVARRIEEDDAVGQRVEDEPGRDGEHDAGKADQRQPPLLAASSAAPASPLTGSVPRPRLASTSASLSVSPPAQRVRACRAPPAHRPAGRGPYRSGSAAPNPRRRRARPRAARRASATMPSIIAVRSSGRMLGGGLDILGGRSGPRRRCAPSSSRERLPHDRRPRARLRRRLVRGARARRRSPRPSCPPGRAPAPDRSAARIAFGSSGERALEGGARLRRHHAAVGADDRLAEVGLALGGRAREAGRRCRRRARASSAGRAGHRPGRSPPSRGRRPDCRQGAPRPARSAPPMSCCSGGAAAARRAARRAAAGEPRAR